MADTTSSAASAAVAAAVASQQWPTPGGQDPRETLDQPSAGDLGNPHEAHVTWLQARAPDRPGRTCRKDGWEVCMLMPHLLAGLLAGLRLLHFCWLSETPRRGLTQPLRTQSPPPPPPPPPPRPLRPPPSGS